MLFIGIILLLSSLFGVLIENPFWYLILILCLWFLFRKIKSNFSWGILIILLLLNLGLNRLVYFKLNPASFSFDKEQSFLAYPGISESIARYKYEGLWIPYSLRNIFYGKYLILFSWLVNMSKLISPLFWVKTIGFSGSFLMFQGVIIYLIDSKRNIKIGVWFLLVIISSSLRVLGDTNKFVLLALPPIIYWMNNGLKQPIFRYHWLYFYSLLALDFILK